MILSVNECESISPSAVAPSKELLQIYNPFAKTDDLQNPPVISKMPVRLYQ